MLKSGGEKDGKTLRYWCSVEHLLCTPIIPATAKWGALFKYLSLCDP